MGRNASLTVFTASIEPNTSPAARVSAYGRHVYEDDVAQLALCEVGDADYGRVALDAAPLVVVRVFQICGYVHGVVIV